MKSIFCILLIFLYSTGVYSQAEILIDDTTKVSWSRKHVFFLWGISPLTNSLCSSARTMLPNVKSYVGGQLISESRNWKNSFSLAIVTLTLHTRINLIDLKERTSIALNFPLGFGPSIMFHNYKHAGAFTNEDEAVAGIDGHLPVMISYNKGFHSTFNNTDNKGGWIGLGVDYIISPIVMFREDTTVFNDNSFKRAWIQPVIGMGLKSVYMNSETAPRRKGIEVYIGFLNGWSVRAMFTHIIKYD